MCELCEAKKMQIKKLVAEVEELEEQGRKLYQTLLIQHKNEPPDKSCVKCGRNDVTYLNSHYGYYLCRVHSKNVKK